jgi:hypothetical protein
MSPITPGSYRDVFNLLEQYNVRYVVIGGVAVVLHGHLRLIADLDIVIAAAPAEQNRALQVLLMAGFVPSIPVPLNLLRMLRMFDQSERELDVFVKHYIAFDDLWNESIQIGIGESGARVVSLEHLVQLKRMTARPHDLSDNEALLALRAS